MTYTGDVLVQLKNGEIDAEWANGQPLMTDGFETALYLSIFGDRRTWQNLIATTPDERYVSRFPDVIAGATVSEATKKDGVEALKTALAWMVSTGAAGAVTVTGAILSVYAIGWAIDITRPDGTGSRYLVNWDKGALTADLRRVT